MLPCGRYCALLEKERGRAEQGGLVAEAGRADFNARAGLGGARVERRPHPRKQQAERAGDASAEINPLGVEHAHDGASACPR